MSLKGKTLLGKKNLIIEINSRLRNSFNCETNSFAINSIEWISLEKYETQFVLPSRLKDFGFKYDKFILQKHEKELSIPIQLNHFQYSSKFLKYVEQGILPEKLYFYDNLESIITCLIFEIYPLDDFNATNEERYERLEILNEFCDDILLYIGSIEELIYEKCPFNLTCQDKKFPCYYSIHKDISLSSITIQKSCPKSAMFLFEFLDTICLKQSQFNHDYDPDSDFKGIIYSIYEKFHQKTGKRIYWYKSELEKKDFYLIDIKVSASLHYGQMCIFLPTSWLPYNEKTFLYPDKGSFNVKSKYLVQNANNYDKKPEWTMKDGECFIIFKFTLGQFIFNGFSFVFDNDDECNQNLKFEYSNDNQLSWNPIALASVPKMIRIHNNKAYTNSEDQHERFIPFETNIKTNIIKISLIPDPEKENILILQKVDFYGDINVDTNQKFIHFDSQ